MRPDAAWAFLALSLCFLLGESSELFLDQLRLPNGFKISVYAEGIPYARSLDLNPDTGTVFVSSFPFTNISGTYRKLTQVYALRDTDNDGKADVVQPITEPLWMPNGIAYANGSLYVALMDRIYRYDNIEENIKPRPPDATVLSNLPAHTWHGWRYIRIDPQRRFLYVAIGAPCNVPGDEDPGCLDDPIFATIQRLDLTAPNATLEPFAHGIRNSVGMTFHPDTKELWFTDNGRDNMHDHTDLPPDEVNVAPTPGLHFGFPYCYGFGIPDPPFNPSLNCSGYVPAKQELAAHAAALGLRFYTGSMFPEEYRGGLFVAEHGSWNRQPPTGYRVTFIPVGRDGKAGNRVSFLTGFLPDEPRTCETNDDCPGKSECQNGDRGYEPPFYCSGWGRPVDLQQLADGSLLVTDDLNGVVYRITYEPSEPLFNAAAIVSLCFISAVTLVVIVGVLRRKFCYKPVRDYRFTEL